MQIIHHLIARKEAPDRPVACASRYEDAADFVKVELEGRGVISLFLAMGRNCPYCKAMARPGIDFTTIRSGQIALPSEHPAFD